jgi:membrane associated rhomboid family serine protease
MATNLESHTSEITPAERPTPRGWFRVGMVAAVSALAGGLAAAWYYRKTLNRLKEAEERPQEFHSQDSDGPFGDL